MPSLRTITNADTHPCELTLIDRKMSYEGASSDRKTRPGQIVGKTDRQANRKRQTDKQTRDVLQLLDGAVDGEYDNTIEDKQERHAIITVTHMLHTMTDAATFNTFRIPTCIKHIPYTTGRQTCQLLGMT